MTFVDRTESGTTSHDGLYHLRQFLRSYRDPDLGDFLRQYLPEIVVVVDSSFMIGDVRFLAKNRRKPGARTGLQEAMDSGTVRAFAPLEAKTEVESRLGELVVEERLDRETLSRIWDEYSKRVTFLPAKGAQAAMTAAIEERDPDDAPFVALGDDLGARAILTMDRDIADTTPAAVLGLKVAIDLRAHGRANAKMFTIMFAGGVTVAAGVGGVYLLVRLARLISSLPPWAIGLIAAGVGGVLVYGPTRRAIIRAGKAALQEIKEVSVLAADAAAEAQQQAASSWKEAEAALPPPPRLLLRQALLQACHVARKPLTVTELETAVRQQGYSSGAKQLGPSIHRALRADRRFILADNGWALRTARAVAKPVPPATARTPRQIQQVPATPEGGPPRGKS